MKKYYSILSLIFLSIQIASAAQKQIFAFNHAQTAIPQECCPIIKTPLLDHIEGSIRQYERLGLPVASKTEKVTCYCKLIGKKQCESLQRQLAFSPIPEEVTVAEPVAALPKWQTSDLHTILKLFYSNPRLLYPCFIEKSFCLEPSCPPGSRCQFLMTHQERIAHNKMLVKSGKTTMHQCPFCQGILASKTAAVYHAIWLHQGLFQLLR